MFWRHLRPALGAQKLREFSRACIQQLISLKHRQGYATQTLAHVRNLLSKVLGTAVLWGWLQDNQARGVKLPPWERRRLARVLTVAEISKLSVSLEEPARTIVILGVLTGLRIGELLGLRVEDLDSANAVLHVRRTVCRGEIGTPKTSGSARGIPLPEAVVNLLRQYLTTRPVESDWIFPTSVGTFQNDRTLFLRKVQPVCKRLGIGFTWHSLRHTFSTFQGNYGAPMPVLQSLLGHTTAKTTMVYTHPLEKAQREAMDRLARILFPILMKSVLKGKG